MKKMKKKLKNKEINSDLKGEYNQAILSFDNQEESEVQDESGIQDEEN